MKKIVTIFVIATLFITTHIAFAEKSSTSGSFAQKLSDFSLKDPDGKTFTNKDFSKDGLVLVVTAPILKNKSAQKKWNKYLLKTKSGSKAKLVFIEDLQASFFKGKAVRGMKKDYKPGKEPILLIDVKGEVRTALKVQKKKTVVLVYDGDGKLVHAETHKPSMKAAEAMWEKLKDSTAALSR